MFCKHCGKQIDEVINYCPYCGGYLGQKVSSDQSEEVNATVVDSIYNSSVQASIYVPSFCSFGEAVKCFFTKIFLFKGRTSRSEFNFGYLFYLIIGMSIMTIGMIFSNGYREIFSDILNNGGSVNFGIGVIPDNIDFEIFDTYIIATAILNLIDLVFFPAMIYRRTYDYSLNKSYSLIVAILYGIGSLISLVNVFIIFDNWFNIIGSLISLASLVFLIICVFKKSDLLNIK